MTRIPCGATRSAPRTNSFAALLGLLDRIGLLKVLPHGAFTALARFRPPPKELSREPIRMRTAAYRRGELLAARSIDAEGDYNSTTVSTTLLSRALLELIDKSGVQPGVCCVEDLLDLEDLQAELHHNRVSVQPLVS